jgi:hypothetical protein
MGMKRTLFRVATSSVLRRVGLADVLSRAAVAYGPRWCKPKAATTTVGGHYLVRLVSPRETHIARRNSTDEARVFLVRSQRQRRPLFLPHAKDSVMLVNFQIQLKLRR